MAGSILTTIGQTKLNSATPLEQVTITHLAVGDGGGTVPTIDPSMTALVNEVWRGAASAPVRDANNANTIIFEATIPPNVGGFVTREIGIFDAAGDMIAVGNTAIVEKPDPLDTVGVALTCRIFIALDNAADVDLIYQDGGVIDHGGLANRNPVAQAHTAEAISYSGTNVKQHLDDLAAAGSTKLVGGVEAGDLGRKYGDFVTVADFSPTGGNDNPAMSNAVAAGDIIYFTDLYDGATTVPDKTSLHISQSGKSLLGGGRGGISSDVLDSSGISVYSYDVDTKSFNIEGMSISVNDTYGASDDYDGLRLANIFNSSIASNRVDSSVVGIALKYLPQRPEPVTKTELRSCNNVLSSNVVAASYMGYEIFAAKNNVINGSIAYKDGARALAHGLRITGYGGSNPPVWGGIAQDLKNYSNSFGNLAIDNYYNGISVQSGSYSNAISGVTISNCENGLQFNSQTTVENISRNNIFDTVTIDGAITGISCPRLEKTVISNFCVSNSTGFSVNNQSSAAPSGLESNKFLRFDGLISDSEYLGNAAWFDASNSRIDITLASLNSQSTPAVVITGDSNIVDIVAGDLYNPLTRVMSLQGSNNIVRLTSSDVAGSGLHISVNGSNNTIEMDLLKLDGGLGTINVGGTGNIFRGRCAIVGTIPAGNDISGIAGVKRSDLLTQSTDASGDLTITHGLIYSVRYIAKAFMQSASPYTLSVHSKTSSQFKVRVYDATGAAVVSTSVTVAWEAEAIAG